MVHLAVWKYSCSWSSFIIPGWGFPSRKFYLYQLESNGTATYLTKVTAPDKAAIDCFGESVSQSGNILAVGLDIHPRTV